MRNSEELARRASRCCAWRRRRMREQQQLVVVRAASSSASDVVELVGGRPAPTPRSSALVPAAIKSKGTLTVAADASYAPNEFIALGRPHGDRDGRRPDEGARRRDGPEGRRSSTRRSTGSSRAWPPASTTSARRRSPTPRSARRRSTSSTYFTAGESFFTKASGGATIAEPRRPVRPHGRRREGHHRGDRRHDPEREVHDGRQAGGDRARRSPTRTAPTWRSRAAGRSSASPTRRWPRTRSSSPTGSSSSSAPRYANAPYGLAIPKNSGLAQADAGGAQGADAERHVQDDPDAVGHPGRRDHRTRSDQRRDQLARRQTDALR